MSARERQMRLAGMSKAKVLLAFVMFIVLGLLVAGGSIAAVALVVAKAEAGKM